MTSKLMAGVALCGLVAFSLPVSAADMPVRAPVAKAPPVAIFNWTGGYIGANYGTGISEVDGTTATITGSVDRADDRFTIGAQLGYNWQIDPRWVFGLEADIGWLGIDRHRGDWNDPAFTLGVKTDWYATARARLGTTNGPSLFFVTAGAAFVDVTNTFTFAANPTASASKVASGWTAGAGIETMLGGNWTSKTEYLYIDAGSQSVFDPATAFTTAYDNRFHVFRKALNYRFGGPSVQAAALPAHNWNGFYVGVNLGSGLSQVHGNTNPAIGGSFDIADSAFNGGVQAGYNWQFAPHWVVGVEADIGWLGFDRLRRNWNEVVVFGVETDWYATLRGRLGYSTGPALLYVTGGAAFVKTTNHVNNVIGPVNASSSDTSSGWVIGSGLEAALGGNWTATTEYLLIDAGSQDVTNLAVVATPTRFENKFHVFRFGLNYKFGS